VTGRVLSKTGWEVVLSWEELCMGPARRVVGIQGLGWEPPSGCMEAIDEQMQSALARLAPLLKNREGR
jgi:hypothetical protein